MIYDCLFDWQKDLVNENKNRFSYGLFLDMGTGKTPISLSFAEINNCDKVIIISLNCKVIEKESDNGSWLWWAKKSKFEYNFHIKNESGFDKNSSDLLLINYESLYKRGKSMTTDLELRDNIKEFINSCKGHNVAIIIDESHKVKNASSKQTKAISKIQKLLKLKTPYVYTYLLTGTPFTTEFIDLHGQLKLLGCEMTKTQFIDNFCVRGNIPGLLGWQQPIVSYKNEQQLYDLVHKYSITMKSEKVVKLPKQIFINHILQKSIHFDMFTQEKVSGLKILDYAKTYCPNFEYSDKYNVEKRVNNPFYANINYPDLQWLAETSGTFWLRARQLSIGFQGNAEKSKWFDVRRLEMLKDFLEKNEENYLLFYNYTPELLEIYQICDELGYNIDVYCGEIKSQIFYEKYSKQSEAERLTNHKNIILANYDSGSTGINWQNYNHCILFSLPLFSDYDQGIKRIHRIGQKLPTFYHIFFENNWLDNEMKLALEEKTQYSNDLFYQKIKFNQGRE